MSSDKENRKELLRNLESSFEEAFMFDKEVKRALLLEMGYDPEKFVARGIEHVKRLAAKQRLILAGQVWEKLNAIIAGYPAKFSDLAGQQLRLRLEEAFAGSADRAAIQAAFRDLKEVNDQNLRVVLEDSGILDQLDILLNLE